MVTQIYSHPLAVSYDIISIKNPSKNRGNRLNTGPAKIPIPIPEVPRNQDSVEIFVPNEKIPGSTLDRKLGIPKQSQPIPIFMGISVNFCG